MASPSPSNDERTSRNVRQRINEPNVEPENKKATWIAIEAFSKETKEVKLKWRNNTVSEFMDPATSFDTAGAFQRLVEHLEKAANEMEDHNDDEELEAWIAELTRLQKEYEKLEAMDHVMDQERAFCCSTCRCTEDENMIVSADQVGS
jgi:ATP-dependent protease HslVU (ClpYQ) peptidase subunit